MHEYVVCVCVWERLPCSISNQHKSHHRWYEPSLRTAAELEPNAAKHTLEEPELTAFAESDTRTTCLIRACRRTTCCVQRLHREPHVIIMQRETVSERDEEEEEDEEINQSHLHFGLILSVCVGGSPHHPCREVCVSSSGSRERLSPPACASRALTHTHSQIRNHLLVSAADDAPVPGYLVCSVNSQKAVLLEMRAGYFWVPTQLDLVLKALLDELMRLSLLLKAQWRPLTQFNTAIQDFSDLKKMWEIQVCCGWLPRCC